MKSLFGLLGFLAVGLPTVIAAAAEGPAGGGNVPGKPFEALEQQIDELRARIDELSSAPPTTPRPVVVDSLDQEIGTFLGIEGAPLVHMAVEGHEFALALTGTGYGDFNGQWQVFFDQPDCQGNGFITEQVTARFGGESNPQDGGVIPPGIVRDGDVYASDVSAGLVTATVMSVFSLSQGCSPSGPFTSSFFPAPRLDAELDVRFTPPFRLTVR